MEITFQIDIDEVNGDPFPPSFPGQVDATFTLQATGGAGTIMVTDGSFAMHTYQ